MNNYTPSPAHTAYMFCIGLCESFKMPCQYKLTDKSRPLFSKMMEENYLPPFDEFATALSYLFDRRMDFKNDKERSNAQSKLIDWYIDLSAKKKEIHIKHDRIIHSGRFIEMIETTVAVGLVPHQSLIRWEWVHRVNNTRAVVMPCIWIDPNDEKNVRLIVTCEFRVPIGGNEWGFPAGLQDKNNEKPIETAKREVKEETGLDVVEILKESNWIFNSAGLSDESVKMIYCRVEGEPSNKNLDAHEEIQTYLMTRQEVSQLLNSQENIGAKAWIIMNYFVDHGTII